MTKFEPHNKEPHHKLDAGVSAFFRHKLDSIMSTGSFFISRRAGTFLEIRLNSSLHALPRLELTKVD